MCVSYCNESKLSFKSPPLLLEGSLTLPSKWLEGFCWLSTGVDCIRCEAQFPSRCGYRLCAQHSCCIFVPFLFSVLLLKTFNTHCCPRQMFWWN